MARDERRGRAARGRGLGRAVAVLTVLGVSAGVVGCGAGDAGPDGRAAPKQGAASDAGVRDRPKQPSQHDEASIRQMLRSKGASSDEASRIVRLLSGRLTADQMHVWLSHPKKSHPIPDPDAGKAMEKAGLVGGTLDWTAVNAISAGKTPLVIDEAERYAAGG